MSTTPTITEDATKVRPSPIRNLLIWMLSFLAFPVAGLLGTFLVGPVDNLAAALLGGAVVGAIVGLAQSLVSRGRLTILRWTIATAIGASAGVAIGTLAIGYGTTLVDLAIGGLITGAIIGVAQAVALPAALRVRLLWIVATTVLWASGWAVTTLAGVGVEEQFIVFGATGAFVYTALAGLVLLVLRVNRATVQAPKS